MTGGLAGYAASWQPDDVSLNVQGISIQFEIQPFFLKELSVFEIT